MIHCRDCKFWRQSHVVIRVRDDYRVSTAIEQLKRGETTQALATLEEPRVEERFMRCGRASELLYPGTAIDTKGDFGCVHGEAK